MTALFCSPGKNQRGAAWLGAQQKGLHRSLKLGKTTHIGLGVSVKTKHSLSPMLACVSSLASLHDLQLDKRVKKGGCTVKTAPPKD